MAKVLLVDDAPAEFALEHSFLGRTGSLLLTAGTRFEILEKARAHHPDLILLETRSPGLEAIECCRAIKSDDGLRSTPLVLLCTAADAPSLLAAGGDGVSPRPLNGSRLVHLVRRYVPVREREHDRAAVAARVHYRRGTRTGLGFTRDIGAGGVFLHTGSDCEEGDLLDLLLRLPVRGEREVVATGRVARVEASEGEGPAVAGVGIRFERLSARDRIEIGRFVREHGGGTH
jgi:CheY-like chemotaxis protein